MNNRFWVYDNHPNDAATVHSAGCSFCNDGRGLNRTGATDAGEWFGPYDTMETAETKARRTKKGRIRWCGFCARKAGIDEDRINLR